MKRNNIHIFGIPEREEKVIDSIFKAIMAENFLNLGREVNIQIREASKTSNRLNLNRAPLRNIKLNCQKSRTKKKFLKQKEKREKLHTKEPP